MHRSRSAFTLVELSIVLVVIGLIIGGIMIGQSLIRASELRSVMTQEQRFITAISHFRDKYYGLPGDLTNGQSYWGVADSMPITCITTATTTATCNGDGNQKIDVSTGSNEYFRFWQQLASAGLIEGNFDGIAHGSFNYSNTAANSPASRINSSLWWVYNYGILSGISYAFDGVYDNILLIGIGTNGGGASTYAIFKPEEAFNIDTKMDDGKPATGNIVIRVPTGLTFANCTDASASSTLTASYLTTSPAIACTLIFRQAF